MRKATSLLLLPAALSTTAPLAAQSDETLPSAFDAGWNGEDVCERLFENAEMRVARCTFPSGIGHERHYHRPHWGYILQGGTMRITDADGTEDVTTESGGNWWSDGVEWHEAVNVGSETSVYLIVEPKGE
ncbi:cupin domain-containing protein [Parasphingopyxis marina]|uniref:Cupin domain-containing protein n=1 Tax=Parasphingopyxis marina TaxID=2761622 RepID=A0A842HYK3_9SPHN|nr:cupin domain-containing protein [Parasphingopyxis marina]MBC2778216.1 cupin domain-containing protein [Parasphingopyxis marina]